MTTRPRPHPAARLWMAASATLSTLKPDSDVPTARHRSLLACHSAIHWKRSSRSVPSYGTIGLAGSCSEPWISLSACCGKPAFCL
eukprot:2610989-Prymnesium_polylepis.1